MRQGRLSFLGHTMRKQGIENIIVTRKTEGERDRWRLKFQPAESRQRDRDGKKYRRQKRTENHDQQRSNWIRHLEKKKVKSWFPPAVCSIYCCRRCISTSQRLPRPLRGHQIRTSRGESAHTPPHADTCNQRANQNKKRYVFI